MKTLVPALYPPHALGLWIAAPTGRSQSGRGGLL